MRTKINKNLGLLKRIKPYLPYRLIFYNSFILPLFDYAHVICDDRGNAILLADLQILQNKAARIILVLNPRSSATDAFNKLSWKNLEIIRSYNRVLYLYKCKNNCFIHYFEINLNEDCHNYNTKTKSNFRKTAANCRRDHRTLTNV